MKRIITFLYSKLERHAKLALAAIVLQICLMLICVSKLKIEEDISKALPSTTATTQYQSILESSSFFRKIIFQVSFNDTVIENPDALIDFASSFIEQVKEKNEADIESIQFIQYKIIPT